MDGALAWLLRTMRRVRFVFVGLYLVVAAGYLWADPHAGWTWFIVLAGAGLCLLFWGLVAFWSFVFTRRPDADGRNGTDHG
ncbi:hypothetical protein GGC47_003307 [Bosea sp. OAE752]|jgi:hypothetical protein|uniref:Uncharacterized protein n=1 Tax=Bosea spartocytisi TaxID=2773451 RepID=A0A927E5X1_9HYPH|nr:MULTISPECIES: hypothetical protein [Bosea]MBD3844914.1 hypothetical protein [Bosea spartocytisi]MCT4471115.1 hypothetical protein [Bosea spartocytisi]